MKRDENGTSLSSREEVIQYELEAIESDIWMPIIETVYGKGAVSIGNYRDSKAFSREIGNGNGSNSKRNSEKNGSGIIQRVRWNVTKMARPYRHTLFL